MYFKKLEFSGIINMMVGSTPKTHPIDNTFSTSRPLTREERLAPLKRNQKELGRYFKELAQEFQNNQDIEILLVRLANAPGYQTNALTKVLKFAEDQKAANEAQIRFVDKYRGNVFTPTWDRMYQNQNQFLDQKIISYLHQLIQQSNRHQV